MAAINKSDRSSELAMQKAANESLRLEVSKLKHDLEIEINNIKEMQREKQVLLKGAREQERTKAEAFICDLKNRLQREKNSELINQKETISRNFSAELQTILHQKEEIHRKTLNELKREKEELQTQLRKFHKSLHLNPKENSDSDRSSLLQEVQELKGTKKKLEDSLNSISEADRMKASEIRRILDNHQTEMNKLKKYSKQEIQRLMEEIKSKDRALSQLERELCNARSGNTFVSEPDDLKNYGISSRFSSQSSHNSHSCLRNSKDDLTEMTPEELRIQIQNLGDGNKQLVQEKNDLIKKLKAVQKQIRPLLDKNKKFLERNMELTATNKLLEDHSKKLSEESHQLKEELKQWKQSKNQSDSSNTMIDQLERQINDLKQALKDKDRKLELLQHSSKNQKLRRLKKKFGSAGVVSDEESDASASSLSIDTIPEEWDEFTWGEFEENFRRLNKEHLELEKSYSLLQKQIGGHVDPQREIKETAWIEEKQQLNGLNRELHRKIKSLEEKESKLQQELQEIQDQNELLEFRLLELEDCHEKNSQGTCDVRHQSVSTDDGVFSNSEEEEIKTCQDLKFCDLKDKINQLQTKEVLSGDEKSVLIQARAVFDILDKRLTNLQISESALKERVTSLEKEKVELLSAATGVSAEIVVDYETNRQKLLEATEKISTLVSEVNELKKREATLKYVQDHSDKAYAKSKQTISELKRQIQNAMEGREFENQMLQETLKKMKESETHIFQLELSIKTMKEKNQQLESENNNLQDQLSGYQDEPSVTESENDNNNMSIHDVKTSVLDIKSKLESYKILEEEWKSKLKKKEEEKNEMQQKMDEMEKSEKEWIEKSQNLDIEVTNMKEEIKRLSKLNESVIPLSNANLNKLTKENNVRTLEKLHLLRELEESDEYLLHLEKTDLTSQLQEKLENALLSEKSCKEKVIALENSETLLKNHLEIVEKREKSFLEQVSNLEKLNVKLRDQLENRNKLLQERLETITSLEQTKEEMKKEFLELQTVHQNCLQQLKEMEIKILESSQRIELIKSEYNILEEKLKYFETKEEQNSEIEKLNEKITNLEKQLDIKENEFENRIQELEEKNESLEEQVLEWIEMENDLKLSEQKLQGKVKAMEEIEGVLRLHLSEMEEGASKAVGKIHQMEETEMDLTSRIYDLEAVVQKYEERNNVLESELTKHSKAPEDKIIENVQTKADHTEVTIKLPSKSSSNESVPKLLEKISLLEQSEMMLMERISEIETLTARPNVDNREVKKDHVDSIENKMNLLYQSEEGLLERLAEQERIENRLQNRLVNAEHERIEMREQLEKMRQKISNLEESENSFQKKIRHLQGRNFLLERKISQTSDENSSEKLLERSERLSDSVSIETQTEENLQKQLSSESNEDVFESLHLEIIQSEISSEEMNLKQKASLLEKDKQNFEKQLNEKNREVLKAEAHNKLLELAKKELGFKVEELEKVKNELEAKVIELELSLNTLRQEVTAVTLAIETDVYHTNKPSLSSDNNKIFVKRMEELVQSETLLKQTVFELKKKEEAYRETLEEADSIMKEMEKGYKMQIEQMEHSEASLKTRINQLEQAESRLKQAIRHDRRISDVRKVGELLERLLEVEASEKQLKEKNMEMQHSEKALQRKLKEYESIQNTFELELKEQDEVVKHLHAMEANEKALKNKIEELENESCALQETLAQADSIMEEREKSFKDRIAVLEKIENELSNKLNEVQNSNFKQKDVINFLNCRIRDLQIELKSYTEKEIVLKHERDQLQQEKDELLTIGEGMKQRLQDLQNSENQLYQEVLRLRKYQNNIQNEVIELQTINKDLKDKMEQFQLFKNNFEEEINKLNNKNRELRYQLKSIGKVTNSDVLPQIDSSLEPLTTTSDSDLCANVVFINDVPKTHQSPVPASFIAGDFADPQNGNPEINECIQQSSPTLTKISNAENVPIETSCEVDEKPDQETTPLKKDEPVILCPQDQTPLELGDSEIGISVSDQVNANDNTIAPPLPHSEAPTQPDGSEDELEITENHSRDEKIVIPFSMDSPPGPKHQKDKRNVSSKSEGTNKSNKAKLSRQSKNETKEELDKLNKEVHVKNQKIQSLQDDLNKLGDILQLKNSQNEAALIQSLKDELESVQIHLAKKEKELQTMDTEGAYYQSLMNQKDQELLKKEKEWQQARQELSKWREGCWTEEHLRKRAEKMCQSLEEQLHKLEGIESKYNDINITYRNLKQDHEKLMKKYQELLNQDTKLHQLEQTGSQQHHQQEELQTKISRLETELRKKIVCMHYLHKKKIKLQRLNRNLYQCVMSLSCIEKDYRRLRKRYEEVEQLKTNSEMSVAPLRAKLTCVTLKNRDKDHLIHKLISEVKLLRNGEHSSILDEAEELQSKTDTTEYARADSPFGFSGPESEISEDMFSQQWRAINYHDRPFSPIDSLSSSMSSDTTENMTDDQGRQRSSRWGHKSRIPRLASSTKSSSLSSLSITRFISSKYSSKDKEKVKKYKSKESSPEKLSLYRAVCDYKPSRYVLDGLPELPLKEGDIVAVIGQHENGRFFKAQVNGKLGLVPISHLLPVQNPESFNKLKKKNNKSGHLDGVPEKILNLHEELLQLREAGLEVSRPNRTSSSFETVSSQQPSWTSRQQTSSNVDSGLSSYQTNNGGIVSLRDNGKSGLNSISYDSQSSKTAIPEQPSKFCIDRVVGNSSLLISWCPPSMDEFARSKGVTISGYKICVDGQLKLSISSPHRSKALLENMKLNSPVHVSIETLGENGQNSSAVNIVYDNVTIKSETSHSESDDNSSVSEKPWHLIPNKKFLATSNYTHRVHSPQREPLGHVPSIRKGDKVTTFGPVRPDGYYYGEVQGQRGLIPISILEEVKRTKNEHKLIKGHLKTNRKEVKSATSNLSGKEEAEALLCSKASSSYSGELSKCTVSEPLFTPTESSV